MDSKLNEMKRRNLALNTVQIFLYDWFLFVSWQWLLIWMTGYSINFLSLYVMFIIVIFYNFKIVIPTVIYCHW